MSSDNPDTRTRILDAAWALLEAAGGREVRMSDIARRAGISRQALYLHFPKRAELLVATTRHIDAQKRVDARLAASRAARTGPARLDAFIAAWGGYIPEIHGVSAALRRMAASDEDARLAWADRMGALREGCAAAVEALARDGLLAPGLDPARATDMLWTLLSVENWERLTRDCGWSQAAYLEGVRTMARAVLCPAAPG